MKCKYYLVFLVTLISCSSNVLEAQFNFKVGIGSKYMLAPTYNNLVELYNEDNDDNYNIEEELNNLRFVNGVHLGIRRKTDAISYEISWEYLSSKSQTFGEESLNGPLFEQTIYYTVIDTYLGLEYASSDNFSYGITLGPRSTRIRRDIGNSDNKINMTKAGNPQWTSKVYTQVMLGGRSSIRFALRPYYEFAWSKLDLSQVVSDLNIPYSGDTQESFHSFGLTLLFYNGPQ